MQNISRDCHRRVLPARGTLAGHFTRRLSPSPMPGKRLQQQRAYLPLKRSSPRPQFYRVAFSIAELDSGIVDSDVMVADTLDGAPLPPKQGPLRIVAPREKRAARWVRMLKSITVVIVPPR